MTPEKFRQTEELFHRARALPTAQQEALLDAECPKDAEVRAEVEKLLAQADPEETLEVLRAGVDRVLRPKSDEASSDSIGPTIEGYKIVREIHRGGQGVVYQASQVSTKRKVAIKVLLEGPYASKSAERRFEREIELVASLKHPNIISIFHSGKAPDGRQFCVMDYVRGVPVHHFVRDHKLTIEETLKLFQAVCDAVNYAHQKGVIHRDLKPSNILVDADGVPKVLDFGLAKMVGGPEQTLISVTGQVVGTLPYMSPEQARGNPDEIDIRTDVYALGVVLYEMLTGRYPYPVVGQMGEVLKHIAETAPTPPSRNWTSDSGVTKRSGKRLRVGECPIDDEVQTIVLRTLAKERERRYQSAGELRRDIGHYLADEPIEAKQDSGWYVLRKQLRRYKVPVAVAAAFVLLLGGSTVALSIMYQNQSHARQEAEQARDAEAEQRQLAEAAEREQRLARQAAEAARTSEEEQRKRAEQREEEATAAWAETQKRTDELEIVTEFQQSMLSEIDAEQMGGALFADLRERVRESLEAEKVSPEDIESALKTFNETLGRANATDAALTLIDEQVLNRAVEAIERDFADQPVVRAALQQTVADTYIRIGLFDAAMPLQEAALATRRTALSNDDPDTLISISTMGTLLQWMGKYQEALPYYREALEGNRRMLGDEHLETLKSIGNMGALLNSLGRLSEAEQHYREALETERRVLGDDHLSTLTSMGNMGSLLSSMGRYAEAEPYFREALEGTRRVRGDDDPRTLTMLNNMGSLLDIMGKHAEAEPYYREALAGRRRVQGNDHVRTLIAIDNMGVLLSNMGKHDEAERYHREALDGRRRVLGDDHPHTMTSLNNLGFLLQAMGKLDEAEPYYREALEGSRRIHGDDHPSTLVSIHNMGRLLWDLGRLEEAEALGAEAVRGARAKLGSTHPFRLAALYYHARTLKVMQRFTNAEAEFLEAYAGTVEMHGEEDQRTISAIESLAELYDAWQEAEPDQDAAAQATTWRAKLPTAKRADSLIKLGRRLLVEGRHAEAEASLRECLEIRREALTKGHWLSFNTMSVLGEALAGDGKFAEAEPLLLESQSKLSENAEAIPQAVREERLREALDRIIKLYESWHTAKPGQGYDAKAAEWRAKLLH